MLWESFLYQKSRVLIFDDCETNRAMPVEILKDDYEIIEASGGERALEILQKEAGSISPMLSDVVMPETDGYDVLVQMNSLGMIEDVPVIMISAESSRDLSQRHTTWVQRIMSAVPLNPPLFSGVSRIP